MNHPLKHIVKHIVLHSCRKISSCPLILATRQEPLIFSNYEFWRISKIYSIKLQIYSIKLQIYSIKLQIYSTNCRFEVVKSVNLQLLKVTVSFSSSGPPCRDVNASNRILCKKVPGKKVSAKKPGNKNLGKKSEFFQVLGKNDTENKILSFRWLGLFFLNSMKAANKVSGNKITGTEVLMKIYPKKKKTKKKFLTLVRIRSSLRLFHHFSNSKLDFLCICTLEYAICVFLISYQLPLFFAWLKTSFVPMHFLLYRTFSGDIFV